MLVGGSNAGAWVGRCCWVVMLESTGWRRMDGMVVVGRGGGAGRGKVSRSIADFSGFIG